MYSSHSYKTLILDFDGTIAETLHDIAMCMTQAFEEVGETPPSVEAVRSVMSVPLEIGIPRLLGKVCSAAQADEWVVRYRRYYNGERPRKTQLFRGAKDLLLQAEQSRIPIILVSNKGSVAIRQEMEWLGITHLITKAFPVDAVEYKKPDPRLYHAAIRPCFPRMVDSEVLVVGDSDADLRFAKNAGLRCCWASYGYGNREECMRLKPDMTVESLAELIPLIALAASPPGPAHKASPQR